MNNLKRTWSCVRILFWKNSILRSRSKVLSFIELAFPFLISVILACIRGYSALYKHDNCQIQPTSLPSMGQIAHMQSIFCNFNNTCSKDDYESSLPFGGNSKTVSDLFKLFEKINVFEFIDSKYYNRYKPLRESVNLTTFRSRFPNIDDTAYEQLLNSIPKNFYFGRVYSRGFFADCSQMNIETFLILPDPADSIITYACSLDLQNKLLFVVSTHFTNEFTIEEVMGYFIDPITEYFNARSREFSSLSKAFVDLRTSSSEEVFLKSLSTISKNICNPDMDGENDISRLYTAYVEYTAKMNDTSKSTKSKLKKKGFQNIIATPSFCSKFKNTLRTDVFGDYSNRILQYFYGKVVFHPVTPFTQAIMERASQTFKELYDLGRLLIDFNDGPRQRIEYNIRNNFEIQALRKSLSYCSLLSESCQRALDFISVEKNIKSSNLHYTDFLNAFSEMAPVFGDFLANCIDHSNRFIGVSNSTFYDELMSPIYVNLFGVKFDTLPNPGSKYTVPNIPKLNSPQFTITYSYNPSKIDTTTSFKVLDEIWSLAPRRDPEDSAKYLTSGLLDLQTLIDRSIISILTGKTSVNDVSEPTYKEILEDYYLPAELKFMPTQCYVQVDVAGQLLNILPLLTVLSWIFYVINLVRNIVSEKQTGLKEYTRIMGVSNGVHQISWILIFLISALIISFIIAIIFLIGGIITGSAFFLMYYVNLAYGLAICFQMLFLSNFFTTSNISSIVLGILYFFLFIPFPVMERNPEPNLALAILAFLLPQIAYSYTLRWMLKFENVRKPLTFYHLRDRMMLNSSLEIVYTILMLHMDIIIYGLLHWYFQELFPGPYGVGRPFYFPFQPSYWLERKIKFENEKTYSGSDVYVYPEIRIMNDEHRYFEPGKNPNVNVGVKLRNLTKIYDKKKLPVVDNLCLDFYRNQITALLGHNGAGKTTTLSILTGLVKPSSGEAYLEGYNIAQNPDLVRQNLGFCPQHNILVQNLTVYEHIILFGTIKGLTYTECVLEADRFLKLLNFQDKKHEKTKNLSGGQKRKLVVCFAFLGRSGVVILDEPTAGVDPSSRRLIWEMIISLKFNRTIILTTHHMDEAEILSDRIVVIAEGNLQTIGSPIYLKTKYHDGYKFIFKRDPLFIQNNIDEDIDMSSKEFIRALTNVHNDVSVRESTSDQIMIKVPMRDEKEDIQRIIKLIEFLEDDDGELMHKFGYSDFVMSDFTLEDVFLKVARDPSFKVETSRETWLQRILKKLKIYKFDDSDSSSSQNEYIEIVHDYSLIKGPHHYWRQFYIMIYRRFMYFLRNKKGWLIEIIMPVLLVLFALLLERFIQTTKIQPRMNLNEWQMNRERVIPEMNSFFANEFEGKEDIYLQNASQEIINAQRNLSKFYKEHVTSHYGWSGSKCFQTALGSQFEPENLDYCFEDMPDNNFRIINKLGSEMMDLLNRTCQCSPNGDSSCSHDFDMLSYLPSVIRPSLDRIYDFSGFNVDNMLMKMSRNELVSIFGGIEFKFETNVNQTVQFKEFLGKKKNNIFYDVMGYLSAQRNKTNDSYWHELGDSFRKMLPPTSWIRIHFNNKGYTASPSYLSKLHNLQLRAFINPDKALSEDFPVSNFTTNAKDLFNIVNYMKPMDSLKDRKNTSAAIYLELTLVIFLIVALSFLPANFVVFLIKERRSYTKQLQIISGLNRNIYWLATLVWDCINYGITIGIIIILFFALDKVAYTNINNVGAFILILLLYGPAVILLTYPATFIFKSSSTAFIIMLAFNLTIGSICTIITFILDTMGETNTTIADRNETLKNFFLIFPQFCMGRGILNLARRYFLSVYIEMKTSLTIDESGKYLIALGVHIILFGGLLIFIENDFFKDRINGFLERNSKKYRDYRQKQINRFAPVLMNKEVTQEADRVAELFNQGNSHNTNVLTVFNLYKKFAKKKVPSVNQLSFAVSQGECFGLLGMNGAGKTSTFKMITSIMSMTSGEISVNGCNIKTDLQGVIDSISYCPQFDAIHSHLTCRENLKLFGILRGIPRGHLKQIVDQTLKKIGLNAYANTMSSKLSGGNRRKLSTAVALMRDPKLILLDEPTTGMDPVAKRLIWKQIRDLICNRRSVVLTSHSMEECETLCNRLGVMAKGQFKNIGTVNQIKNSYSTGYFVDIRLNPDENKVDFDKELALIFSTSLYNEVEHHMNFIKIQFDRNEQVKKIFYGMEKLKMDNFVITYSVYQPTLDDAFYNLTREELANDEEVSY